MTMTMCNYNFIICSVADYLSVFLVDDAELECVGEDVLVVAHDELRASGEQDGVQAHHTQALTHALRSR